MDDGDRRWIESMPTAYERGLVEPVFTPFAKEIAGRAATRHPARVLELAAGTGALTRELLSTLHGAAITATDLSAEMVDLGRGNAPAATWQPADAMDLPFEDSRFDLVTCAFGVMFVPDKRACFAEVARVLDAHGTFLFAVWGRLDQHGFQACVVDAVHEVFPDDPPTFLETVPHGYADTEVIRADLDAAGFDTVAIETVTLPLVAETAADVALGYCQGTPLRAQIEARGSLDDTTNAVAAELARRFGGHPIRTSMAAIVVEAMPR
ncbi:MAG: methyltransferase domain-containing protein [Actinobacteria bacterium]|nr:methyltransferase domain-containing protein [Actinomycetota bacterium]